MKVTTQQELRYSLKVEILLKRHLIDNAEKPILFINSCGDSSEFSLPSILNQRPLTRKSGFLPTDL